MAIINDNEIMSVLSQQTKCQFLNPELYNFTFCHRGAPNSFIARPISAYVNGEIQNPHSNQAGSEAA